MTWRLPPALPPADGGPRPARSPPAVHAAALNRGGGGDDAAAGKRCCCWPFGLRGSVVQCMSWRQSTHVRCTQQTSLCSASAHPQHPPTNHLSSRRARRRAASSASSSSPSWTANGSRCALLRCFRACRRDLFCQVSRCLRQGVVCCKHKAPFLQAYNHCRASCPCACALCAPVLPRCTSWAPISPASTGRAAASTTDSCATPTRPARREASGAAGQGGEGSSVACAGGHGTAKLPLHAGCPATPCDRHACISCISCIRPLHLRSLFDTVLRQQLIPQRCILDGELLVWNKKR